MNSIQLTRECLECRLISDQSAGILKNPAPSGSWTLLRSPPATWLNLYSLPLSIPPAGLAYYYRTLIVKLVQEYVYLSVCTSTYLTEDKIRYPDLCRSNL